MKKIGVLAGLQGNLLGVTRPYIHMAQKFGKVVIINPLLDEVDRSIDLLILVGGADLDPNSYGAVPSVYTNKPNPVREWFDRTVLPKYIANETPIFGICLGLQSINVAFGGTLEQHNSLYHSFSGADRSKPVHKIVFTEEALADRRFRLSTITKPNVSVKNLFEINSLHHQSIATLGEELIVHAHTHKEDRGIEIIAHRKLPIVGVQYHPEELEGYGADEILHVYIPGLLNA